jgi:hypothetical protein
VPWLPAGLVLFVVGRGGGLLVVRGTGVGLLQLRGGILRRVHF